MTHCVTKIRYLEKSAGKLQDNPTEHHAAAVNWQVVKVKGNLEVCIEYGKMREGVSTQRHAWMRSNRDL